MLAELHIRNLAIIDEVHLHLLPGFNILTGETGAGKSIILDSILLLVGGRADRTLVRAGSERAVVDAVFNLDARLQTIIGPMLETEGLENEEAGVLLLGREVRDNGRSIGRINGRAVSLSLLEEVGDYLVDIHGQGEHLSLLKPKAHLPLLDAYAGLEDERARLSEQVATLRALQRELHSLQQDERLIAQRIDLLSYQVEEINAAQLQPGEEVELLAERTRLANAERLLALTAEASGLLSGLDDSAPSVTDLLSQAERALTQLTRVDGQQQRLLTQLQGLLYQFNDLAAEVTHYQASLEFNPERLAEVEERIELLSHLKRKYGEDIPAILVYRDKAARELDGFTHSEERMEELAAEIDRHLHQIGRLAAHLSQQRRQSAERLARSVESELRDLHVQAEFAVDFNTNPDPRGAYVGDERLAFDQTGIDRVEFLISTNPGEPLKPMAKTASGGETSRLMLALKTALAQVDATPTLIFDEIDQGIGGRIGETVGHKLWDLAAVGGHQVIVVTHLPQLAGYGDSHFHVSKHSDGERTVTQVSALDYAGRVEELAAMLGTHDEHARGGAISLLQHAADIKAAARA